MADGRVLIGDCDGPAHATVEQAIRQQGFDLAHANSWHEAVAHLKDRDFDVLLLDLDLPGLGGFEGLGQMMAGNLGAEVVVMSDEPSVARAVEAMTLGVFSYVAKPLNPASVGPMVRKAAEKRRLEEENSALRLLMSRQSRTRPVICNSEKMKEVFQTIERIGPSSASVLIRGETGSGKGLVARAIHDMSLRAQQPFMHVNCGAIQEQLLESELFGHEKGSFTGATQSKLGLFEVAHGGTLFLDEIAEMSPGMQAKLLLVLDAGQLRRVGGTQIRQVDTRILAATNKNLKDAIRAGSFRKDLYFRLNVVSVRVPPLSQRKADIPDLVTDLLERFRPEGGEAKKISRRALKLLMEYHWPGNVRELANVIESVSLLAPGEMILPDDLPPNLQPMSSYESQPVEVPLPMVEMERLHILKTLEYTDGKKAPAARLLGIDVKTLSNKIRSYRIEI